MQGSLSRSLVLRPKGVLLVSNIYHWDLRITRQPFFWGNGRTGTTKLDERNRWSNRSAMYLSKREHTKSKHACSSRSSNATMGEHAHTCGSGPPLARKIVTYWIPQLLQLYIARILFGNWERTRCMWKFILLLPQVIYVIIQNFYLYSNMKHNSSIRPKEISRNDYLHPWLWKCHVLQ